MSHLIAALSRDTHRARHFAARSAGQVRRRQRDRAERTAPNLKLPTTTREE